MAATFITVSYSGLIINPQEVQRLWFFPDGSEYLRYSPHFHMIETDGFRQNLPLVYTFVIVLNGYLSVKDYWGETVGRIDVREQVWYERGTYRRVPRVYDQMLPALRAA